MMAALSLVGSALSIVATLVGFVRLAVSLGKAQGATDSKIRHIENRLAAVERDVLKLNADSHKISIDFASFSGRMDANMRHLLSAIEEIKDRLN